jgi:flagellar biosynthesis protein FlhA
MAMNLNASTTQPQSLAQILRSGDLLLAIAMISVVGMMIVPLPPILLDLMLVTNITCALLVLMVSLYVSRPLEFSSFPALLLILTLLRLALNVSTTRLILLDGAAGKVIDAFGKFVVGGNYAVGVVIFVILIVIQFIVITNGAGRISEVAARFTLDAMPGKQMAIDADLNAGLISEVDARKRRADIQRESDFYGTMDGASKFVRGDAIAGIIIIIVNIIGGLAIGVLQKGLGVAEAASRYTLLTVGDGLVSQVPALIISVGTGILVSKAANEASLGDEIGGQVFGDPRVLTVVAVMLGALGLVPGLPKLPFFLLASMIGTAAYYARQTSIRAEEVAASGGVAGVAGEAEAPKGPENVMNLLSVDTMELEIGYRLIPLVDAAQGGDLLDRITMIRRQTALKMGLVLPPIRVRDNLQLKPIEYILILLVLYI